MSADTVALFAVGVVVSLSGAIQVYILREIAALRRSRHVHANVLQRHVGRFGRIAETLRLEWDDLENDLGKG